jgi:hypothetical protein
MGGAFFYLQDGTLRPYGVGAWARTQAQIDYVLGRAQGRAVVIPSGPFAHVIGIWWGWGNDLVVTWEVFLAYVAAVHAAMALVDGYSQGTDLIWYGTTGADLNFWAGAWVINAVTAAVSIPGDPGSTKPPWTY